MSYDPYMPDRYTNDLGFISQNENRQEMRSAGWIRQDGGAYYRPATGIQPVRPRLDKPEKPVLEAHGPQKS